ncbi:MAG: hypothetical protein KOO66_04245 [Bacteroidales bacterium]|nr:hypothetical protein [Bacteroidales bacterium]
MNQARKRYLIIWMISSIFLLMGFTKDLPFDKEDQKKLEKAQKLNQEAQKLIDKANSLYSEIAEYDASNPKNANKTEKLKDEAVDCQLSAVELQKEANFIEFNVLKNVIPELKTKFLVNNEIPLELKLMEEQAEELFYKAEKLRNEAYKLEKREKDERYLKLLNAQEHEKSGLDRLNQVIDIYSGNQKIDIEDQTRLSTDQNGKEVVINEELLNAYINYVNTEDSVLSLNIFRNLLYSDSLSVTSMKDVWDDYLYSEAEDAEIIEPDEVDIVAESINQNILKQADEISSKTPETNIKDTYSEVSDDIIYKVQIAADKKPLSQNTLRRIYNGNKEIKMIIEEGWSKYSIGDFNTFSEADDYKKTLSVGDAFVVAYKNGVKVDLFALKRDRKKPTYEKDKIASDLPAGLIFKVQIAAKRIKMLKKELNNIYLGDESVDMIEEENWYKYSVGKHNSYEQAVRLKESLNVKGSFIVAYNDEIKVPLYLARKGKLSDITQKNIIVFKVQIAADKRQLTSEKLHAIYSGHEKINKFEEDNWYKYSVGEFNNFNDANEFRKKCGAKGAFVIAFKGNNKMNVLEAKKSQKCFEPVINKDWISKNTDLVFKVQIAASPGKLTVNQIKNICCIEPNVYLIEENDWFKYSIGNLKSYYKAVEMKEISGVNGAFIVAYKNGQKINTKDAIKLSKN